MEITARNVEASNRIHVFSLKPTRLSGVELIRLIHIFSCDFENPLSLEEPLFWRTIVRKGSIEIPESLKSVASTIKPKDIYSFRDLSINGEQVSDFSVDINFKNLNEVAYQIICKTIAEPRRTYHVSYIEEGLYKYDDYYEEEIRTSLQGEVFIFEKPQNLKIVMHLFGANIKLNILKDTPRTFCAALRGKSVSGNGVAIRWHPVGQEPLNQEVLSEKMDRILEIVQQNPKYVQALLDERLSELSTVLLEIAEYTKDKDIQKAEEAKLWHNRLKRGISVTADLIQIVTFLVGIKSLPDFTNNSIAHRIGDILNQIISRYNQ